MVRFGHPVAGEDPARDVRISSEAAVRTKVQLGRAHGPSRPILAASLAAILAGVSLAAAPADEHLLRLVKARAADAVRTALAQGTADANAAAVDGTTVLHWATHLDDAATVDVLLAAGADASAENRYGVAPLSLASTNGNAAIVERLLGAGADVNWATHEGQTALMTAARTGNAATVDLLLTGGANVNAAETWRGQTALMWAAAERHVEASRALLRYGADVQARTDKGFTPLLFAVRAGDIGVVRELLAAGADIDGPDEEGNTPIVLAIYNGHYALAAFLLEQGADPDIGTPGGTALHHAVRWRTYEFAEFYRPPPPQTGDLNLLGLIERLLAHGADPNAPITERFPRAGVFDNTWGALPLIGASPLVIAARAADVTAMRALLAHGADPHLPTDKCVTPLMVAAGMGFTFERSIGSEAERLEAVELLVGLGANLHAVNDKGETAMHGAARSGTTAVVTYLFQQGVAINVESDDGWTPLENADGTRSHFSDRPETAALIRDLLAASHVH